MSITIVMCISLDFSSWFETSVESAFFKLKKCFFEILEFDLLKRMPLLA